MSRTRILFVVSLLMSLVMLLSATGLAQYGAGLQGTVQDKSGAVVTGATVTLADDSTGTRHTATTNSSGFYRVSALTPGSYTVTVEARGFKKSTRDGVVVEAELLRGLDVTVELGQAQEIVNVTENSQALQTEDATISGTLTALQVSSLPSLDRDPYELLRLAPGIFGDGARFGDGRSSGFPNGPGANGGTAGPGGSNTAIFQVENQQPISAQGQRITSNDYLVDGVSVNSLQWGGAAVITPSIESVQEITVLSNDYDASDGRSSGAHIKTTTKTGTNAWHGGGLFAYHSPGLNAFNRFNGYNPSSGFLPSVRDNDRLRQFAGTLGGPIVRNKLFFFFNYEGLRTSDSISENNWVETPQFDALLLAARAGTPVATILQAKGLAPRIQKILPFDCTLWAGRGTVANPACVVVPGGIDIGSPFSTYGTYNPSFSGGNPARYVGGGLDGIPDLQFAQIALPASTKGNQYNVRADYTSGKNVFSTNAFLTFLNTSAANAGAQGRPMADYNNKPFSPSGFLSWVRTISPTLLNEARFNFTRYAYNDITANPQINWAIPRIEIQDLPISGQRIDFGAAQGDTSPGIFAENTVAFRDVVSKVLGNKALKFGFEYSHEQNNDELIGGARPDQVFEELWNFANGTPIFEAVEVNPLTGGAPLTRPKYFRSTNYGFFAQNDWKVRPNLTVNAGLRWEYFAPPTEAKGHLVNFVPANDPVNGLVNGKATNPSRMWNPTWRNFGPRLGFAWSPLKFNNAIVIRGGFGIAFDRFDDVTFDNSRNNPPFVANYGICCGTAMGEFGSPFVMGQIAFNTGTGNSPESYPANPALQTPLNANGLPQILTGQGAPNIYSNPVHMPIPYVYLTSLQMQQTLPKQWVLTLGYQGSAGHKLTRIRNLAYFYPATNTNVSQIFTPTPDTNSNFHALNTQLEHRFEHGFTANVLYTWSKSIDQVSAEGPGFGTNQTYPIDDRTERGPSDYDTSHNFRAYGVWELPIFRGRKDFLGKVAGGWTLNGIFQFHSGFPWTPVSNSLCPVLGASGLCPLRPIGYNGGAKQNHDNKAFLPPTSGNFPALANLAVGLPNPYFTLQTTGNVPAFPGIGRNTFRGPRYTGFDMGVAKSIGLPDMKFFGEGARIEMRMTLFNAFNKENLAPFTFGSASTIVSYCCGTSPAYNSQLGTATSGLSGRVMELQARFSF